MLNITLLLALVEQYTINLIGSYVNVVLRMQDNTITGTPAFLPFPIIPPVLRIDFLLPYLFIKAWRSLRVKFKWFPGKVVINAASR